ncbi:unnamed protein product [Malus baccata var. baccata]
MPLAREAGGASWKSSSPSRIPCLPLPHPQPHSPKFLHCQIPFLSPLYFAAFIHCQIPLLFNLIIPIIKILIIPIIKIQNKLALIIKQFKRNIDENIVASFLPTYPHRDHDPHPCYRSAQISS